MTIDAHSTEEYISLVPEERKEPLQKLVNIFRNHLPEGFEEEMNYKMIGFVVPHSIYPAGYHYDPKMPLPYINLASQKNFLALYHHGLYGIEEVKDWFINEYPKHAKFKLDMGKSCIRFKRMDDIPFALIEELAKKMNTQDVIKMYEPFRK